MFDEERNLIEPITDEEKNESAIAKELALRDLGDLWQDIAHESLESIKAYKRLLQTVEGTIEVIGRMVEQRDRYTYVHQKEVAELAVKIGKAMNLDDERIECIRVAGLLHDIGKIAVPIEILSKPDKISSFEMRILETHPRIGYDIIHGIPFPWPIDEIIYQHHERIDGSGYPRGLIGERIMTESKIIAVADVLNAMISHRPYRAAHPIGKALNFLIERKGVFFDGDIVDVCVSLFTTGEKTVKTMDRG